jgi:exodeoxyribonuclease V beta subunit
MRDQRDDGCPGTVKPLDSMSVELAGTTLIEASAGTGKTYTITTLVLRLLVEDRLRIGQILVVTFTQAAAAELRDRIRRRLLDAIWAIDVGGGGHDPVLAAWLSARRAAGRLATDRAWLQQAVSDFDEAPICTIHAFCQRVLTEHAFESRTAFEVQLVEQQLPLLEEIAYDYWGSIAYQAEPDLVRCLRKQTSPDKLLALTHKALRDPAMPVLPDAPSVGPILRAPFDAARARAASIWETDRREILAQLCVPERLKQNTHPIQAIQTRWAEELDRLGGALPLELPSCAVKLTVASLQKATRKQQPPPTHAFFDAMTELEAENRALSAARSDQVLALRRELCDYARAEVSSRREQLGVLSFDDLLFQLQAALRGPSGEMLGKRLVTRYPAALIDEFQDTDPVQYDVFRRLYAEDSSRLFLIGDPKQAIYGFRGADIFAYMQAARGAARAYTLDVNHRSDPALVQAVNSLFSRVPLPFVFPEIRFDPVRARPEAFAQIDPDGPALSLLFVPRTLASESEGKKGMSKGWADQHLPRLCAFEIAALLQTAGTVADMPLQPHHIAVLCRTNEQARRTARELARLGVPTVLDGDSSVFDTEMAGDLAHVLSAISRPSDPRKLGVALQSSILGVSGETLHLMQTEDAELELWLDRLTRWNLTWHERGFIQMWHQLLEEGNVRARLLSRRDGERRLTDLLHLAELLHEAAVQQHLGPLSLLRWFTQMRGDPKARRELCADSAQLRLEHDEHALKLTTIHRSKGLEYPIVFCPFSWADGLDSADDVCFHDRDDNDRLKLDIGSPERDRHAELARREALAENLRLLYVALTRARHRCYVVWGRFNRCGRSPLGWLLHPIAGDPGPAAEAIEEHLDTLSDAGMIGELAPLVAASEGTIGLREIASEEPAAYVATERFEGELAARTAERVLLQAARMSSFSRLIAARGHELAPEPDERFESDADDAVPDSTVPVQTPGRPLVLADFPSGSSSGSLIHGVFERIDFQRADRAELDREVAHSLRAYGMDEKRHGPALAQAIDETLRTPLGDGDPPLTLSQLGWRQRRAELEFTLSTGQQNGGSLASALARAFERHLAPAGAPSYAGRLRTLGQMPRAAYLKGFIDLVFQHRGRFYIVDYKSNRLGDAVADYRASRLGLAMHEHDYFLQYHLYALALDRHLRLRVPDYSYDRCFGGIYYLFVRGMSPEHPGGTGVFFDRPSHALLQDLGSALGAGAITP